MLMLLRRPIVRRRIPLRDRLVTLLLPRGAPLVASSIPLFLVLEALLVGYLWDVTQDLANHIYRPDIAPHLPRKSIPFRRRGPQRNQAMSSDAE